jgi:hypothetical protein
MMLLAVCADFENVDHMSDVLARRNGFEVLRAIIALDTVNVVDDVPIGNVADKDEVYEAMVENIVSRSLDIERQAKIAAVHRPFHLSRLDVDHAPRTVLAVRLQAPNRPVRTYLQRSFSHLIERYAFRFSRTYCTSFANQSFGLTSAPQRN